MTTPALARPAQHSTTRPSRIPDVVMRRFLILAMVVGGPVSMVLGVRDGAAWPALVAFPAALALAWTVRSIAQRGAR